MAITALDAFAPATGMLEALRQRRVSSTELVELHLRRISQHNPALNAIVVPADDPQAAARQADEALAGGDGRTLLGLPVTLKESMNVRGLPVSAGVPEFASYRAVEDGPIPQR